MSSSDDDDIDFSFSSPTDPTRGASQASKGHKSSLLADFYGLPTTSATVATENEPSLTASKTENNSNQSSLQPQQRNANARSVVPSQSQQQQQTQQAQALNLDSTEFSPARYCAALLNSASLTQLLEQSTTILSQKRQLDSEMHMLVYENYARFLRATDMIQSMRASIETMQTQVRELNSNMRHVSQQTSHLDSELAVHRGETLRLASTRALLQRLSGVLQLPSRLDTLIQAKQYADATQCWLVARRALRAYTAVQGLKRIEHKAQERVARLVQCLQQQAEFKSTIDDDASSALDACCLLTQLQVKNVVQLLQTLFTRQQQSLLDAIVQCQLSVSNSSATHSTATATAAASAASGGTSSSSSSKDTQHPLLSALIDRFIQRYNVFANHVTQRLLAPLLGVIQQQQQQLEHTAVHSPVAAVSNTDAQHEDELRQQQSELEFIQSVHQMSEQCFTTLSDACFTQYSSVARIELLKLAQLKPALDVQHSSIGSPASVPRASQSTNPFDTAATSPPRRQISASSEVAVHPLINALTLFHSSAAATATTAASSTTRDSIRATIDATLQIVLRTHCIALQTALCDAINTVHRQLQTLDVRIAERELLIHSQQHPSDGDSAESNSALSPQCVALLAALPQPQTLSLTLRSLIECCVQRLALLFAPHASYLNASAAAAVASHDLSPSQHYSAQVQSALLRVIQRVHSWALCDATLPCDVPCMQPILFDSEFDQQLAPMSLTLHAQTPLLYLHLALVNEQFVRTDWPPLQRAIQHHLPLQQTQQQQQQQQRNSVASSTSVQQQELTELQFSVTQRLKQSGLAMMHRYIDDKCVALHQFIQQGLQQQQQSQQQEQEQSNSAMSPYVVQMCSELKRCEAELCLLFSPSLLSTGLPHHSNDNFSSSHNQSRPSVSLSQNNSSSTSAASLRSANLQQSRAADIARLLQQPNSVLSSGSTTRRRIFDTHSVESQLKFSSAMSDCLFAVYKSLYTLWIECARRETLSSDALAQLQFDVYAMQREQMHGGTAPWSDERQSTLRSLCDELLQCGVQCAPRHVLQLPLTEDRLAARYAEHRLPQLQSQVDKARATPQEQRSSLSNAIAERSQQAHANT